MTTGQKHIGEDSTARAVVSLKAKCAGAATGGLLVTLTLAPEALARIAVNHSETLVAGG